MTVSPDRIFRTVNQHVFRSGLEALENAYRGARSASDNEKKRLERQWTGFLADVAAGKASMDEIGEDGEVLFSHGEDMGEMVYEQDISLKLIREAFTITLSHFWERSVARMMRKPFDELKAFEFLRAKGIGCDEAGIHVLRLTANVAKHSAGTSASKLFKVRPDLFDQKGMQGVTSKPSYNYLVISDDTVEAFFDVVRKSGP